MSLQGIEYYVVDAFTTKPFTGNPAAVVLLLDPPQVDATVGQLSTQQQQDIALEIHLSETAFVRYISQEKKNHFEIRYFTPTCEIDLCGHATLASAHILYSNGIIDTTESIHFESKGGHLVTRCGDNGEISMAFPTQPAVEYLPPRDIGGLLYAGLGVDPAQVVRVSRSRYDIVVELKSKEDVVGVQPEMSRLGKIDCRGIIVTAAAAGAEEQPDTRSDDVRTGCSVVNMRQQSGTTHSIVVKDKEVREDFVSRFFAPASGIPEDPVTGSAHCTLAPYWKNAFGSNSMTPGSNSMTPGSNSTTPGSNSTTLGSNSTTLGSNSTTLVGRQVSKRGGIVMCRMDEGDLTTVHICGHAVTISKTQFLVS